MYTVTENPINGKYIFLFSFRSTWNGYLTIQQALETNENRIEISAQIIINRIGIIPFIFLNFSNMRKPPVGKPYLVLNGYGLAYTTAHGEISKTGT